MIEEALLQEVLHLAVILQCFVIAEIQSFIVLEASQDYFYFFYNVTDLKIGNCNFPS